MFFLEKQPKIPDIIIKTNFPKKEHSVLKKEVILRDYENEVSKNIYTHARDVNPPGWRMANSNIRTD